MDTCRVLVATDFSETADLALAEAHERVGPAGALAVCYARHGQRPAAPPVGGNKPASATTDDLIEAVTERVVTVTGRPRDNFVVAIDDDEPYAAIVRRAEAWAADLVVVGYRGSTGLKQVWLGGVAEKVVRYAHCPVLVVRPRPGSQRIIVGTDFSDPALPAVRAACEEARRVDGQVTVVHAVEMPLMLPDAAGLTGAEVSVPLLDDLEADANQKLLAAMAACQVPGDYVLTRERPALALVRQAESVPADLLVVGTHGRSGLSRVLLGSTAEAVVRTAPCSVLVVRLHEP